MILQKECIAMFFSVGFNRNSSEKKTHFLSYIKKPEFPRYLSVATLYLQSSFLTAHAGLTKRTTPESSVTGSILVGFKNNGNEQK